MKHTIKKVLIANRAEVVHTVIQALHAMKKKSVAVYEQTDSSAIFIHLADQAVMIGEGPVKDYLDIEKIIAAAKTTGADAIHPGYGFLSESADFASACAQNGLIFIGPPPEVMSRLGDKVEAKNIMRKHNIPTVPNTGVLAAEEAGIKEALDFAETVGYPVLLKSVDGGGGRGIREVDNASMMASQLQRARHEVLFAFNHDRVFVEKLIESPRHVEIQILADAHGNVVHMGPRDCSIQRRHQKLLEIAPALFIPGNVMNGMYTTAIEVARHMGYVNAGTVEFLYDPKTQQFWFMEVNPRLQVEHSVTEMVTGINIIKKQIEIAEGKPLDLEQDDIVISGNAIHVRINAEDPLQHFRPEGGRTVGVYRPPEGEGIRMDARLCDNYKITTVYDSLLVKLTVWDHRWSGAVAKLRHALDDFVITGAKTTIPFYQAICEEPDFQQGIFDTSYLDTHEGLFEIIENFAKAREEKQSATENDNRLPPQ